MTTFDKGFGPPVRHSNIPPATESEDDGDLLRGFEGKDSIYSLGYFHVYQYVHICIDLDT